MYAPVGGESKRATGVGKIVEVIGVIELIFAVRGVFRGAMFITRTAGMRKTNGELA